MPSAFVVSVRDAAVALSVTVTVALGITPPLASVTVPPMLPVGACPNNVVTQANKARKSGSNAAARTDFI